MTGPVSPQPSVPPRTSRRRAIVVIAAGLLIAGAAIGGLWAWIAPPIHGVVALTHEGERVHDYLGDESELFFVAPFLMLGLLNVVAAVAAVLAWQWRAHRGPAMVTGLCAGVVIAAGAAVSVGALLVHLRYGAVDLAAVPVSHGHPVYYFTEAPPVFLGRTGGRSLARCCYPRAPPRWSTRYRSRQPRATILAVIRPSTPFIRSPRARRRPRRHSGRRRTGFPVITLAAITASRAIPT